MTASELILILDKLPPDTEVRVADAEYADYLYKVTGAIYDEPDNAVYLEFTE